MTRRDPLATIVGGLTLLFVFLLGFATAEVLRVIWP